MTRTPDESGRWIVHTERPVYENEWVTVRLADISQPSGDRFEHTAFRLPRSMELLAGTRSTSSVPNQPA